MRISTVSVTHWTHCLILQVPRTHGPFDDPSFGELVRGLESADDLGPSPGHRRCLLVSFQSGYSMCSQCTDIVTKSRLYFNDDETGSSNQAWCYIKILVLSYEIFLLTDRGFHDCHNIATWGPEAPASEKVPETIDWWCECDQQAMNADMTWVMFEVSYRKDIKGL